MRKNGAAGRRLAGSTDRAGRASCLAKAVKSWSKTGVWSAVWPKPSKVGARPGRSAAASPEPSKVGARPGRSADASPEPSKVGAGPGRSAAASPGRQKPARRAPARGPGSARAATLRAARGRRTRGLGPASAPLNHPSYSGASKVGRIVYPFSGRIHLFDGRFANVRQELSFSLLDGMQDCTHPVPNERSRAGPPPALPTIAWGSLAERHLGTLGRLTAGSSGKRRGDRPKRGEAGAYGRRRAHANSKERLAVGAPRGRRCRSRRHAHS